ncbi:MAG: hypothetical protein II435_01490, partial [Bacteroidales bacterium]|nr:hypothetical protein [Bacteroidales bacterium]
EQYDSQGNKCDFLHIVKIRKKTIFVLGKTVVHEKNCVCAFVPVRLLLVPGAGAVWCLVWCH